MLRDGEEIFCGTIFFSMTRSREISRTSHARMTKRPRRSKVENVRCTEPGPWRDAWLWLCYSVASDSKRHGDDDRSSIEHSV